MKNKLFKLYLPGLLGAALLFFMGWQYNTPAATWLAFPILIYVYRRADKWYQTLPVTLLIAVSRFLAINGGWDISLPLMAAFAALVSVPLLAALYLDRRYSRTLKPLMATLVFPCVYIVLDYALTFANLGMTFSLAYTQSTFLALVQSASLFGSWYVGFIVAWFAPIAVLAAKNIGSLKAAGRPLVVYAVLLALTLSYGSLRLAFDRPSSQTVRVASVTVPQDKDYWSITDAGTPKGEAAQNKPAMQAIETQLFEYSRQAADYGAKIIFWSEGNCPLYEDDYDAFIAKAQAFAKSHNVYFMPAVVEFLYGQTKNNNLAIMIDPDGKIEYRYEKTISWYPSSSDGVVHTIGTPYGKVSTTICFDMDYPSLISQAKNADIMLVPAFDTRKIDDYHTRVAFMRGIEFGFSAVRQANKGSSISADYLGNTLTYQNYFRTDDRIMISDVPTKGGWTLYGATGEVFLWLVCAGFVWVNIDFSRRRRTDGHSEQ
jgi:apolipoprotein N-acyltransferase